jgi:glycosyltransferase involved in cell wall biosynthesis
MPRPARVLYVIGSLNLGGSERHVLHLVSRLDRARFAPLVCCLFQTGPLYREAQASGVPCIALNIRRTPNSFTTACRLAAGAVRLYRLIRRERVAILDAFLFQAYTVAIPSAWLAGVPVRIAQRRGLAASKPRLPGRRLLERLVNRLTTQVVANSRATAQDTSEDEGLPAERICVIHNGVEVPDGPPPQGVRPRGLPATGRIVLCVANLIHYKGHLDLLAAAGAVFSAHPDVALALVGEGAMRRRLEEAVARLGLGGRVHRLGQREDIPALLAAADLFVLPSHQESFSNALLEAMAHGLPVIATAVGGNTEIVEDGVSGILVPPRDPAALGEAMIRLLRDPASARRMGQEARARVAKRFCLQRMVQETETLYGALLARRPAGHGAATPS